MASQISVSAMLSSVCLGCWDLDDLDRRILVIAVPALGSLLVEPIYVLTDTAVVGPARHHVARRAWRWPRWC